MTDQPPAVDPTKNVLDLVEAERKHRDKLREADSKFHDAMREAETRRVNELRAQKQTFDLELAKVLRANQDAASQLLATQLKEVKADLQTELRSLNEFRWQSGGKQQGVGTVALAIATGLTLLIGFGGFGVAAVALFRTH